MCECDPGRWITVVTGWQEKEIFPLCVNKLVVRDRLLCLVAARQWHNRGGAKDEIAGNDDVGDEQECVLVNRQARVVQLQLLLLLTLMRDRQWVQKTVVVVSHPIQGTDTGTDTFV